VLLLNSDVTTIITTITITITIIPSDMWKHLPIRRYFLTSPYEGHNFTMKRSILNKQKSLFFFFNEEQEGKTGPVWGFGTSGSGRL
jgi:hypothetical protein